MHMNDVPQCITPAHGRRNAAHTTAPYALRLHLGIPSANATPITPPLLPLVRPCTSPARLRGHALLLRRVPHEGLRHARPPNPGNSQKRSAGQRIALRASSADDPSDSPDEVKAFINAKNPKHTLSLRLPTTFSTRAFSLISLLSSPTPGPVLLLSPDLAVAQGVPVAPDSGFLSVF